MRVPGIARARQRLAKKWAEGITRKIQRINERAKKQHANANELRDKIGVEYSPDILKASSRAGKARGGAVNSEFRAMKIRKSLEKGWRGKAIRLLRGGRRT